MKRYGGQVTIFLALSALSLLALLSVCLEGARSACLDYLCGQAADSALRSVFAAYQGDMLRDYGLLLSQGREYGGSTLEASVSHFAGKYLSPTAGTLQSQGDRIRLRGLDITEMETVYITEGQGAVFSQAALTYMKSAGMSLLLKEALERLGLYNGEDGNSLLETVKNMVDDKDSSLEGILSNHKDIKEQAAAMQEEAKKQAEEEERDYEAPPGTSEDVTTDLLEQIQTIWEYGLISVITGKEELSGFSWDKSGLPSRLPGEEKALHTEKASLPTGLLDHLLLGEFAQHKMNCYTEKATEGSRYELEYVITGRHTDRDAFEQVVGELILIRMGFNLAYLAGDAEKVALAETTAIAIMSFLALPQLVGILKWILLSAWALAESIVDLRGLVRGKKVPLWKTKGSWNLSAMKLDLSAVGGGSKGLSYEDYLRILFFLGEPSHQAYRMMDVIQERMNLKLPGFSLRDYMVEATIRLEARAAYLYIDAPLIRSFFRGRTARLYTKEAQYAYGRR